MNNTHPSNDSRRTRVIRLLFFALTTMCLVGMAFSFGNTHGEVVKVAFLGSKDDEDYAGALAFKETVERETNGALTVQIFPAGQFCGNARECLEALQSGTLEITMTTAGGAGSLFGAIQVLDLPYAFNGDDMAECVMDGPFSGKLRNAMLEAGTGIRLGAISNTGGWRNFATVDTPVRSAKDLEGLKLRTVTAPIQQEMMRQMGASATPIAWSELYSALATKVVEGTKNSVQDIVGMKFHEHIKHLSLDGHAYMAAMWWISEARWQRFTEEEQHAVMMGLQALQAKTRAIVKTGEEAALKEFIQAGGTVYKLNNMERQSFVSGTSGMRAWFSKRYGDEWLTALDTAVKTCSVQN